MQFYSIACSPEYGSSLNHIMGAYVDEPTTAARLADEIIDLNYLVAAAKLVVIVAVNFFNIHHCTV